jgi:hypothetical protein
VLPLLLAELLDGVAVIVDDRARQLLRALLTSACAGDRSMSTSLLRGMFLVASSYRR